MMKIAAWIGRLLGRLERRFMGPRFEGKVCLLCGHHALKHLLNEGRCPK